ncbi:hypothetical protein GOODEAATRI_011350 [Goodea atripinnis]|uniref:Cardiomyopathy-associated protein 5 n=1 Tax=Goodea atripinnis TaxID=208336 RepID=A0ABV0MR96_9TELE
MVDPSFSMVTVQSEDSGIVWETASSRCSTPWASEASSTSEAYSMEGSGGAGKITIVFDEDKVVRRRTRSGGRNSRLGDRLSRPGSSRSASTLGVERPEMAEVSLPNIKKEKKPTEADLKEIKSKDQQLFSLISEGYEILNIRVPSKLPTVDEEESTDLKDNLSYLDQTPKIRSRNHHDWAQHTDQMEAEQTPDYSESSEDTSQPLSEKQRGPIIPETESTANIDYIEKFMLLDVVIREDEAPLQKEEEKLPAKAQTDEHEALKEETEDTSVSEESFVFVTDAEIVGEHLDEVFYGEGPPIEVVKQKEKGVEKMRSRRESQRSMKDGGLVLFESEETTLTPIFISPGPPKIIDPILLEEPTAMSFMYSDLYEDAVGERRGSDEEFLEAESVASEKSYKRQLSDSEEEDGYLEKFRLKDETPAVDVQSESAEGKAGGRMVWPFEMTGCLMRAAEDEEEMKKTKTDKLKTWEVPEMTEVKQELLTESEEKPSSVMAHDEALVEVPEELHQESKSMDHKESKQEQQSVGPSSERTFETPQMEIKVDETLQGRDETATGQRFTETELQYETQRETEKKSELPAVTPDSTASTLPKGREEPIVCTEHTLLTETTERSLSEEGAPVESKMVAADEKPPPEAEAEVKKPGNSTFISTETLTESEASSVSVHENIEIPSEDVAPLKVVTDCDCDYAPRTVEEVLEKAVNKEEMQTQVKNDVQEVAEAIPLVPEAEEQHKHLTDESSEKSKAAAADQESGVKTETSGEITQPAESKEIDLESNNKHQEMQQEETTDCQSDNLKQTAEPKSRTSAEDTGSCVQDVVNVGDELFLLVPKGKAVDMDIQIGQWSEDYIKETVPTPEPCIFSEVQVHEPQAEEEPIVPIKEEELPSSELDSEALTPAAGDEASTENLETHEDKLVFSTLRSFTPQEHLSELHGDDVHAEKSEQKTDIYEMESKSEINLLKEDAALGLHLHSEDVEQIKEKSETVLEAIEETVDDLGYEVIGEEDAKGMLESEIQREEEEEEPYQRPKEKMEAEVEKDDLDEADYEIIDAEEERESRLAAELQGMDWFCNTCGCLLSEDECRSEEHHGHQVCLVEKAYEDIKDQFTESEAAMQAQNEEMMALVMEQYNAMSVSMEEEKKAKLEQLYDKIVSYQENIDSAKTTLETTAREAETDARVSPGRSLDWVHWFW